MELKDTIGLMTSAEWTERFKAKYLQPKIRYEKPHKMIVMREVGKQTLTEQDIMCLQESFTTE